jgi:hypothetical protein
MSKDNTPGAKAPEAKGSIENQGFKIRLKYTEAGKPESLRQECMIEEAIGTTKIPDFEK